MIYELRSSFWLNFWPNLLDFFSNSSEKREKVDSGALEYFGLTPGRQNRKNNRKSMFFTYRFSGFRNFTTKPKYATSLRLYLWKLQKNFEKCKIRVILSNDVLSYRMPVSVKLCFKKWKILTFHLLKCYRDWISVCSLHPESSHEHRSWKTTAFMQGKLLALAIKLMIIVVVVYCVQYFPFCLSNCY